MIAATESDVITAVVKPMFVIVSIASKIAQISGPVEDVESGHSFVLLSNESSEKIVAAAAILLDLL